MAKNISLAGAVFPDVPSILLPQQGGGMVSYVDVTGTTAVASDVAQGKKFYAADGTETTGTASGGSGSPIVGALRPDAEVVKKWTFDKLLVENEHITFPAYSSSSKTIYSTATLDTITPDFSQYAYYISVRWCCNPIYSTTTKAAGRAEWGVGNCVTEIFNISQKALVCEGKSGTYTGTSQTSTGTKQQNSYWSSATSFKFAAYSYGIYMTAPQHAVSASAITVKSPNICAKGHSTYCNQTYWDYTTDVRAQYVIELWRAPINQVYGWMQTSQICHAVDCINNGGTLT